VFFEAARRAGATLAELAAAFGRDRRAVVCRELSKIHEEIRRGTLGDLAEWAAGGLLGEVTLVVAGREQAPAMDAAAAAAEVAAREAAGMQRKEAIAAVAAESGLPRREVYNAVVAARRP
jgi:16S rRNA (cytidine1402-2'-O)-methyltransferase